MRQPTRHSNALAITLVILLLGMSASVTIDSGDRAELAGDKPALETHANSNLHFPGSQAGSIYSASTVQASYYHTCAVLDNSSVKCWGEGQVGMLGTGDNNDRRTPTQVLLGYSGGPTTAIEIGQGSGSAGHHTCAMMTDNTLQCWGEDFGGQVGHGGNSGWHTTPYPVAMPAGKTAVQISNGGHHTCAIMDDNSLYCWGENEEGIVGVGESGTDVVVPYPINLPAGRIAVAVSTGWKSTCVILDDGTGMCWGLNEEGQLGDGTTADRDEPTPITILPPNSSLVAIATGTLTTCALLDNGSVACWGKNDVGQFGDGTTTSSTSLKYASLPPGRTAISIDLGKYHACSILDDNSSVCWGNNTDGQIGDGTTTTRLTPTYVTFPGGHFSTISTGRLHTCGIASNASLYCWGFHEDGQLGLGTSDGVNIQDSDIPAYVDLGHSSPNSTVIASASLGERDHDNDGTVSIFDSTPWVAESCSPGQYLFGLQCIDASPGYYIPYHGMTEQFECYPGTYQPYTGQSSCIDTSPGYFTDVNGSINQSPCFAGTYQPADGQTSCIDVDRGNYSDAGLAYQIPCAPGTYQPDLGQPSCLDADPGNYVSESQQFDQTKCSPGTYQPVAGQSSCFSASEGHYAPGFGSPDQLACEPGTYSPSSGLDSCHPADPGYYVTGSGAIDQMACPAGSHQPTPASTGCSLVDPGHYSPESGTGFQIPCPAGNYQPNTGSEDCIEVDPGHYAPGPAATSQTECDAGSYAPDSGLGGCLLADPGHHVSDAGSDSQSACSVGYHQPNSGAPECLANEIGHYTDESGTAEQIPCSLGTYQSMIGATSCSEADYGFHVPNLGSAGQEPCLLGTYQSSTGQSDCTDAEPGHYVDIREASVSTACGRGYYQPEKGQSECIDADPGNHVPSTGSPTQTPCERGTFQEMGAQAECTNSQPGYYVSTSGAEFQTACNAGTYQDAVGKMSCKEADVDHFVAASAATNQEMCKDGSTQPERGQSSCTEIDTSPVFAMGAAAAAAVIVLILVYTQSQKKEAPKSRKKIDTDLGHLGDQKRKPRKKRSPEGKRRKRGKRPPEGKRRKRGKRPPD